MILLKGIIMNKVISFAVLFLTSIAAVAGPSNDRKLMTCVGSDLQGTKASIFAQVYVLSSNQVEGMKIQFKKQVLVNEVYKVIGQPYSNGVINNHIIFNAKTDSDLALVLPAHFRMLKTTGAFLSQQNGDEISFTTMKCNLQ